MAKFNYKTGGNEVGNALLQVGTAGLTMVGSNQLLDFRRIFKGMYEKNPSAGWIKHQGGIKLGGAALAMFIYSAMTNKKMNPIARAALIGIMLQGGFQEARVLTTGTDGTNPIDALSGNGQGANLEDLDKLMREAAAMSGEPGQYDYTTGIGKRGMGQNAVDLQQNASSGVGFAWDLLDQSRFQ